MHWADQVAKRWLNLKIAERANGLAGVRAAQRSTQRLVRKTQDGTLGKSDEGNAMPDEDESINIGDPTYHYHGRGGNQLATLALAAVLGAIGAKWIPYLLAPTVPEPAPAADRVNEYELGISTNETNETSE